MTDTNIADLNNGVDNAMTDLTNAATAKPKAKATKPKATANDKPAKDKATAKAKADAPKEPKAEKPAKEPKPEPKPAPTFHGFEVHEGADLAELEALTKSAAEAFDAVGRKDSDLLSHYLSLGAFQSKASGLFKSTKVYGQFLADQLPASQKLDAALRSNCKWLWEAMNLPEHEAKDLLPSLKVNRLEDFKSGNPTVIKREYKLAKDKAALAAKAKAAGVEGDDEEVLAAKAKEMTKAEKEAQAKKDEKSFNSKLGHTISRLRKEFMEHVEKGDMAEGLEQLLQIVKDVAKLNSNDSLSYLQSGGSVSNPNED